jgi:hypothetical protein
MALIWTHRRRRTFPLIPRMPAAMEPLPLPLPLLLVHQAAARTTNQRATLRCRKNETTRLFAPCRSRMWHTAPSIPATKRSVLRSTRSRSLHKTTSVRHLAGNRSCHLFPCRRFNSESEELRPARLGRYSGKGRLPFPPCRRQDHAWNLHPSKQSRWPLCRLSE